MSKNWPKVCKTKSTAFLDYGSLRSHNENPSLVRRPEGNGNMAQYAPSYSSLVNLFTFGAAVVVLVLVDEVVVVVVVTVTGGTTVMIFLVKLYTR